MIIYAIIILQSGPNQILTILEPISCQDLLILTIFYELCNFIRRIVNYLNWNCIYLA